MLILTRSFSFCASHRLFNPEFSDAENQTIYGKCAGKNGHGHNYRLEISLQGEICQKTGMIVDIKALAEHIEKHLINDLDHKHLNYDVPWLAGKIPTTEVLVEAFWERIQKTLPLLPDAEPRKLALAAITLWETEKNSVTKRT